jgi:hypothetical protein
MYYPFLALKLLRRGWSERMIATRRRKGRDMQKQRKHKHGSLIAALLAALLIAVMLLNLN